jgi:methyltransferase of ATP-grasp peptide maturase system
VTDEVIELDRWLQGLADELNEGMIEQLTAAGQLTTPAWKAAFEAVPRWRFAQRFTLPDNLGGRTLDITNAAQREEWLRAVYVSDALLTEFDENDVPTSSCSAPSVVATMLESSQAADGDRVLEIGTGTGWTAGLLSARFGSDSVTSIDINPRCVDNARERLERLGLAPTLAVADGYLGHQAHAPYDRIIATASLRKVPPAWLSQTRPGGTILTDLRGYFAGNLARLTVDTGHSAQGQFLPETVRFMPLRSVEQPIDNLPELSSRAVKEPGDERTTNLNPTTIRKRAFGFLAQLTLPGVEAGRIRIKPDGRMYFCLTDAASQSWARVDDLSTNANYPVTQGGERRLWDELEDAYDLFHRLGQPLPETFTITITPDGSQVVNLTEHDRSWSLPL